MAVKKTRTVPKQKATPICAAVELEYADWRVSSLWRYPEAVSVIDVPQSSSLEAPFDAQIVVKRDHHIPMPRTLRELITKEGRPGADRVEKFRDALTNVPKQVRSQALRQCARA